jgi:predicted ribosome quality control (RQC) complex YloA/Tae2 family protein
VQPVDYTTLMAICVDLQRHWLPARVEQAYQRDRHTVSLALRTLHQRGWLTLCWHPQAAHVCIGDPPPRGTDIYSFSQQLKHQLGGLALVAIEAIAPWERVLDFQFAQRPGDAVLWHLYVEIMGKYSNVILVNHENVVIAAAHQVGVNQSSVRRIQTGESYDAPPALLDAVPNRQEPFERWHERLSLIPGRIDKTLLKLYRGLSSRLVTDLVQAAGLTAGVSTDQLELQDWHQLYTQWQHWLQVLEEGTFQPGWLPNGYTVMGWGAMQPETSVQTLIARYYADQRDRQAFQQLHHQLSQKLQGHLKKLYVKRQDFQTRLQQSTEADRYRERADLLMAYLHEWKPGLTSLSLPDFETGESVTIDLQPDKNGVQNAQALYKRHQKLKRSRDAILPLLQQVESEIHYLEQVEVAIAQLDHYQTSEDLTSLEEIRDELIQQRYLPERDRPVTPAQETTIQFLEYKTPGGYSVLVGRNNRQNDQLTFRVANDYDLWFHTQEIPGSHVLLRLPPGVQPDDSDLQFTANLAAFYSRARQSDQVPVIYTQPKHVYKPKGAQPGIAIYKQETVIWGQPNQVFTDNRGEESTR